MVTLKKTKTTPLFVTKKAPNMWNLTNWQGCKKRAGLRACNTILMLNVCRTVIKLSTVHLKITRYTNRLHNKTEGVHPPDCGVHTFAEQRV